MSRPTDRPGRTAVEATPGTATPPAAAPRPSYIAVLRTPGALRAFVPVATGRAALAMVMLAILLSIRESAGSYALAGVATGAMGLTSVIASPLRARLVDTFGQTATLTPFATLYAAGLVGITIAVEHTTSRVAVIAASALTGLVAPPLGASMRAIWASLTPDPRMRSRAFSLDSVSEDVAFTLGPLAVSGFLLWSSPRIAVIVTAVVVLLATIGLVTSPVSRSLRHGEHSASEAGPPPPAAAREARRRQAPLRQPRFAPTVVVATAIGLMLGTIEIATTAFGEEVGTGTTSGVLLAAFAAGSGAGGLLYGARDWHRPLAARLPVLSTGVAVAMVALAVADGPILYGVVIALAGAVLGPAMVTAYLHADSLTVPQVRTEASAWINTSFGFGGSLASIAAGMVLEAWGVAPALAIGGILAAALVTTAAPFLLRGRP